jgi:hypothetical protein
LLYGACAMSEQWKAMPGYEGLYEVSDQGRVRSLERFYMRRGYKVRVRERILRHGVNPSGYYHVALHQKGHQKSYLIHRLVFVAFCGPIPDGYEINHKDGEKSNNSPYNLEVVTRSENERHAYRALGVQAARGEQRSNLTEQQAAMIKHLAMNGAMTQRRIGKMFGVSQTCVSDIKLGRRWKHLAA